MGEHFIPFRRSDIVAACCSDPALAGDEPRQLRELAEILAATFHFEFHRQLERLKDVYAPLDPNRDTRAALDTAAGDPAACERELLATLGEVLAKGNFVRLAGEELERALNEESVFRVKLHARLDDFAELVLYARGSRTAKEVRRSWFGLRKEPIEVAYYERVVLYARFNDAAHFPPKRLRKASFKPGQTFLKLFQNIPKADLEMLLPNTEVRMRMTDHLIIGVPAIAGGIGAALKLGASLALASSLLLFWLGLRNDPGEHAAQAKAALIALGLGVLAFGMHLFRQVGRFRNRKIAFMKALADSLYYKNLDNNAGVFHRLIDDAEEEEVKEALLAYHFLRLAPQPLTAADLDARVEAWFAERFGARLDFEVDDGLAKLVRLGLVVQDGERYRALPLVEAKRVVDARWDGFFAYA